MVSKYDLSWMKGLTDDQLWESIKASNPDRIHSNETRSRAIKGDTLDEFDVMHTRLSYYPNNRSHY